MDQLSAQPTRKVIAGGLTGAASIVLVWILNATLFKHNPMPAEVSSALTTVMSGVAAYFTKPRDTDLIAKPELPAVSGH